MRIYVAEYAKDFMNKYGSIGRTALLHFYEHEMNTVLDAQITSLVEQVVSAHIHTVVIISSGGHAPTNGEQYYSSPLFQMESKLPLLIMLVPEFVDKTYKDVWETLYHNQQVVTSPKDLINSMESFIEYPKMSTKRKTLFSKKFDRARTCKQAGVPSRWCICDHKVYGKELVDYTPIVREAAKRVSKNLQKYAVCESDFEYDRIKVTGSTDDVVAWTTTSDLIYETNIKTKKTRLISEKQYDNVKVRNGELALCDKRKIPSQDRGLCACKQLIPI